MPAPEAAPSTVPGKLRKLPGRVTSLRLRAQGFTHLYLADTYLLQMQVVSLRESYSKFAYGDIQAITVRRTGRGRVYNIVLAVIMALLLAVAGAALSSGRGNTIRERDNVAAAGVLAGIAGFCALVLVINVVRGATCHAILQTVTGRHPLRTLVRLKPTRRALGLIAERVAAAQGTLDQAAGARQMEDFLLRRAVQYRQRPAAGVAT